MVTLRDFNEATDQPMMCALRDHPELQLNLFGPSVLQDNPVHNCRFFTVARSDTAVPIGFVQIININPVEHTAELSICIAPEHQRKGYGRAAMEAMHKYALTFGVQRMQLHAFKTNRPALTFYRTLGYKCTDKHKYVVGSFSWEIITMERELG